MKHHESSRSPSTAFCVGSLYWWGFTWVRNGMDTLVAVVHAESAVAWFEECSDVKSRSSKDARRACGRVTQRTGASVQRHTPKAARVLRVSGPIAQERVPRVPGRPFRTHMNPGQHSFV